MPNDPTDVPAPSSEAARPGMDLTGHAAFPDLASASAAILARLRVTLGFPYWAVNRVTGATSVVVSIGPAGFPAAPGQQLSWAENLCRLVLDGRVPRIAPDVKDIPAYRDAALAQRWQVAAYLSAPLTLDGSELFGTLCALDHQARPKEVTAGLPLVDLQARLLSTVLAVELRGDAERRRAERAETEALVDQLTGLVNRRGWELLIEREEQRCRRYGALAAILVVDLDGLKTVNDQAGHAAGDALLRRTADVLHGAVRSADVVARLGGDEFAVLAVETDPPAAMAEGNRLRGLLTAAGVPASIGVAGRDPEGGLAAAWRQADADMYRDKRARVTGSDRP